ncbi:MAG: hypothetical protein ABWY16_04335 [Pedobacter sp.]|uniref:hypothetical protein n=1 Tax=Pedobacter sp. TaxID=1411316 RepID=UPI00339768E6
MKNYKTKPIYNLRPDKQTNIPHLRVYNFKGSHPDAVELLTPHRKDHYLIVITRQADNRQWIDMKPYIIKRKR